MSLIKSVGSELVTIILVSSANRIGLDLSLTKFGRSLVMSGSPTVIQMHLYTAGSIQMQDVQTKLQETPSTGSTLFNRHTHSHDILTDMTML
jgi:hypothetical protein